MPKKMGWQVIDIKKKKKKKNGGPKWPIICVLSYLCVTSPSAEMVRL